MHADPRLPYEDNSFDVITNAVSVDYLAKPLEVFREMHRVLKPGGRAIMSFSNRCFPTKGACTPWCTVMASSVCALWRPAACERLPIVAASLLSCTLLLRQFPGLLLNRRWLWCCAAIAVWTSTGDIDHVWIVGAYYHYSVPGGWAKPVGEDISPNVALNFFGAKGDPMYVVHAQKLEA
jgi:SAM-dependent methyltransferase